MRKSLLIFTLAVHLLITIAQETPCECMNSIMNCISKNRTTFGPNDRCRNETTQVILYNNIISTLPSNAFTGMKDLELILLDKNYLKTLPQGIFKDLQNLKIISIAENRLQGFREDVFQGLNKLETIALGRNQLKVLPQKLFSKLQSLKRLDLHYNQLGNSITAEQFIGLKKLEYLDLSENGIAKILPDLFKDLYSLRILHLSDNRLKTISGKDFSGIKFMEELVMDNNKLNSLPMYDSSWPSVETTVLYGNNITVVNEKEMRSWLQSGGRTRNVILSTPANPSLIGVLQMVWINGDKGINATVDRNCNCGSLSTTQSISTIIRFCFHLTCGGPHPEPPNWLSVLRRAAAR